jgi:hypothetical protein
MSSIRRKYGTMFAAIRDKLRGMDTPVSKTMTPPPAGPTYASYLRLDRVLDAQSPLSDSHDELLFIVIHQASELWIKLCLHELSAARAAIASDQLAPALKMMTRVSRVQEQLIQSWGVLATITPADYSAMRAALLRLSVAPVPADGVHDGQQERPHDRRPPRRARPSGPAVGGTGPAKPL